MMHVREIKVSENAIRQARQLGLQGNVANRLRGFAAAAVPHRSEIGNAVYGPYVMIVRGGEVVAVSMTGPQIVDTRPTIACKLCHGLTMIARDGISRPCPRAANPNEPLCDTKLKRITK